MVIMIMIRQDPDSIDILLLRSQQLRQHLQPCHPPDRIWRHGQQLPRGRRISGMGGNHRVFPKLATRCLFSIVAATFEVSECRIRSKIDSVNLTLLTNLYRYHRHFLYVHIARGSVSWDLYCVSKRKGDITAGSRIQSDLDPTLKEWTIYVIQRLK